MQLQTVRLEDVLSEVAPTNKLQQQSLLDVGQVETVRLRPLDNGKYEIVNGRRRIADLLAIGGETVEALVEKMTDTELHIKALVLNSGTPNEMDEALHIQWLVEQGMQQQQIAQTCNYSTATVSQRLKLLNLVSGLRERLRWGDINVSTALVLAKLSKERQQDVLADGEKITSLDAAEALRDQQSQQLGLEDLDVPEVGVQPGLFVEGEQVVALLRGETITVLWQDSSFDLRVTNSGE